MAASSPHLVDVDEAVLGLLCQYLTGHEMARASVAAKFLREACVVAATAIVPERERRKVRAVGCLDTQAYDFDSFSEDGFALCPRRGAWFLSWKGSLRWEDSSGTSASASSYAYVAYGPTSKAVALRPPAAHGRRTVDACVVLFERHLRALFEGPAKVRPLVVCSVATNGERTAMQSAFFHGPAQRWLSLFKLGEWIDKLKELATRVPEMNYNQHVSSGVRSVFCALGRRCGDDDDDDQGQGGDDDDLAAERTNTIDAKVVTVKRTLQKETVLLMTHHEFLKVKRILGDDAFDDLGIPDDMSIYFGGDGTTDALILLAFDDDERPLPPVGAMFGYQFKGVERLLLLTRRPRRIL